MKENLLENYNRKTINHFKESHKSGLSYKQSAANMKRFIWDNFRDVSEREALKIALKSASLQDFVLLVIHWGKAENGLRLYRGLYPNRVYIIGGNSFTIRHLGYIVDAHSYNILRGLYD